MSFSTLIHAACDCARSEELTENAELKRIPQFQTMQAAKNQRIDDCVDEGLGTRAVGVVDVI